MKKTKETILNTALSLFNSKGLAQVKLRTIAMEMGISQGNLNYHFKKREEIIEALYFRLVEDINSHILDNPEKINILKVLFETSNKVMHDLYNYRFIMLDFVQIMRENKKIKMHFQNLQKVREQQFMYFFDLMIKSNLMRKEILTNEYKNLFSRLQMLGDYWISSAETAKKPLTKKSIAQYEEILNQTIFPYLTTKGKREYQKIIKDELI